MPAKNKQAILTTCFLSLLFFGLPLVFTNGFFNITQTKACFFYVIACAFLCLFLFLSPSKKTEKKTDIKAIRRNLFQYLNTTDIAILCFAGFVLLAALLSPHQQDVWLGAAARYQGTITILLYTLIYFAASRHLKYTQPILLFAMIGFCIVCLLGVLNCFGIDWIGIHDRLSETQKGAYISTIGNINFYSSYLCLLYPFLLCGFCQAKTVRVQIGCTAALFIGALGMMVTASESFALGMTVAFAVLPLFLLSDTKKLTRFFIGVMLIAIAAQVFISVYHRTPVHYVPISEALTLFTKPACFIIVLTACITGCLIVRFCPSALPKLRIVYIGFLVAAAVTVVVCFIMANTRGAGALDAYFKLTDEWGSKRGEIWKQCLHLYENFSIKEKLFGIGPESLQRISDGSVVFKGKTLDQAHNEYLQYLLTTGVFGLLGYLSVLITVTLTVIKKLKDHILAIGLLAGLIAYWIQATVNIAQPFSTPFMFAYIAMLGGLACNKANMSATA